jgi:D-glycero-beta-D-manno-heptose-7-phosphate kinase
VATNVQAMGGRAILSGVVGSDASGRTLVERAAGCGCRAEGIFAVEGRPTTVKTRIVAHSQQVVRVDRETSGPLPGEILESVAGFLRETAPRVDALLLSTMPRAC